jgi:hypothetical protein
MQTTELSERVPLGGYGYAYEIPTGDDSKAFIVIPDYSPAFMVSGHGALAPYYIPEEKRITCRAEEELKP